MGWDGQEETAEESMGISVSEERGIMTCHRDPHLLLGHLPEARQVTPWGRGSVQARWCDHSGASCYVRPGQKQKT